MAPKSKAAATSNGSAKVDKTSKTSSPAPSGTSTPIPPVDSQDKNATGSRIVKPDRAAFDAEQDTLKKEIDVIQAKLNPIQDKINGGGTSEATRSRRQELRSEMDLIRQGQSDNKSSRTRILEQLKILNEAANNKAKALKAARDKSQFRTVADVDARIQFLDKQVESGQLRVVEEKKALAEMSSLRKNRRNVEAFSAEQEVIDRDRAAADELRKQLDDPQFKAANDRFDAIKAELDEIKKEEDEVYAGRNKLFAERDDLKAQLKVLYDSKRESSARFREENDRYRAKVNDDRARRMEKARVQRQEEEDAKKKARADEIMEEARFPAFQAEIEDCQTLIDYFSGKSSAAVNKKLAATSNGSTEIAGVPKLEIRKVEETLDAGMVVRKKKGEEEENYFVAKKGKGKKSAMPKANGKPEAAESPAPANTSSQNLPIGMLTALLTLSIPPPASASENPRVIENLRVKKEWFEANQARVTTEKIQKAEAQVRQLLGESAGEKLNGSAIDIPPNGKGEDPAEPAPTPAVPDTLELSVPADEVDHKLEDVQEAGEAEVAVEA